MLATDGLPMPREHFRATYCAECGHIRSEHIEDGICDRCDCVKFTRLALFEMLVGIDV